MDPLTHVRRRLALKLTDFNSDQNQILTFFDHDILNAVQKREQNYVERMTQIFTSQFKNKYAHLIHELETSEKRMSMMDKQMDLMRSQCDRRRLESDSQRRAFLLEIIGLKQSKDGSNSSRLNTLLKRLEEGEILGKDIGDINVEDFELDDEVGGLSGSERSVTKMVKKQQKEITKLKEKNKSLLQDIQSELKFAKKFKDERTKIEKNVEKLKSKISKMKDDHKEFLMKIEQLKMANNYANRQVEELSKQDDPEWWLDGIKSASKHVILLETSLDNLFKLDKESREYYELDHNIYNGLQQFLSCKKLWNYFIPSISARYNEILQSAKVDDADDNSEPNDANVQYIFDHVVAQKMYPITEECKFKIEELTNFKLQIDRLDQTTMTQDEMIHSLENNNKHLESKLNIIRVEQEASKLTKKRRITKAVQVDQGRDEINLLEKSMNKLQKQNEMYEKRIEVYKSEHTHDESSTTGMKKQIKILMEELELRRNDIQEIKDESELYTEEIKDLNNINTDMKHRIDHLETEVNRLTIALHHSHTEHTVQQHVIASGSGANDSNVDGAYLEREKKMEQQIAMLERKYNICHGRKEFFEKKSQRLTRELRELETKIESDISSNNQVPTNDRASSPFQKRQQSSPENNVPFQPPGILKIEIMREPIVSKEEMPISSWGWLASTLTEMATDGHETMPMKMPEIHGMVSSGKPLSDSFDDILLGASNEEDDNIDDEKNNSNNNNSNQKEKHDDHGHNNDDKSNQITLTPEVLSQALNARKWLISQQARMNWAVMTRKIINQSFRFCVENLNDMLEQHQVEAQLDIYQRLLIKGRRRLSRLEYHREQVSNNRQRATEQVLSAASVMAMSPARRPKNIIRNDIPAYRNNNIGIDFAAYRPVLATNTINIGVIPETQQSDTEHFDHRSNDNNDKIKQNTCSSMMGYFPARNMRINKQKKNDSLHDDNATISFSASATSVEKLTWNDNNKRSKRKKKPRKGTRPKSTNPRFNNYRDGTEWMDSERVEKHAVVNYGKIVRKVLRDVETNPTFNVDIVNKKEMIIDPIVLAGCQPARPTNEKKQNGGKNLIGGALRRTRPTSARVRHEPMFRQMSSAATSRRPQSARIAQMSFNERAKQIDMALGPKMTRSGRKGEEGKG